MAFLHGGVFHEHGQSTIHLGFFMVELASRLLLPKYFSKTLWNVRETSMYGCNISVLSMQYKRPLRGIHQSA